jgi:eukaryotic-like serine/threonine-protein kinase
VTLAAGTRLGPYEILAPLGAGGMGEVYRARDTRLGRDVAIKVLPASVSDNPDRLRRFEREARSASALNHPNIVVIHDIGESASGSYIAMELVEGQTLRDVLGHGALPVKRLLAISAQVADGLSRAHADGIVHRDLKPENIMVRSDGFVKVLDFGLAKLTLPEESSGRTEAPTVTRGTEPGKVMGTVGYMSPEQALGQTLDFRSDQFSLGSILYEMATGNRAFSRPSAPETLSAIIRDEPEPIAAGAPSTPALFRWIVERCLAKNREERYGSTHDLARDLSTLRDRLSEASGAAAVAAPLPSHRRRRGLVLAAIAAAALGAGFLLASLLPIRSRLEWPTWQRLSFRRGMIWSGRFAPDAQTVVYSAAWDGDPVRAFSTRAGASDTRGLELPSAKILAISPKGEMAFLRDPRFIFFYLQPGTLARASLEGGVARDLLEGVDAADWSPDGSELAVARWVSDKTRLEYPVGNTLFETDGRISSLRVSRDGAWVAFFEHRPTLTTSVVALRVADRVKRVLSDGWSISSGGLAWSRDGTEIWFTANRVRFNRNEPLRAVTLAGKTRVVARVPGRLRLFDIAPDGRVLLALWDVRHGIRGFGPGASSERDLSWLDNGFLGAIAHDGRTIAFTDQESLFLRRTDGAPPVRLGEGYSFDIARLSPDGRWVLTVPASGPRKLVLIPTGAGEVRRLDAAPECDTAEWFPDGRRILGGRFPTGGRPRLFVFELDSGKVSDMVLPADVQISAETQMLSRDGDRIAVLDTNDGVRILSLPDGRTLKQIPASAPGYAVIGWAEDGRHLFLYRIGDVPEKVQQLDIESGKVGVWRELALEDPAGVIRIHPVMVTPDGRYWAFTYARVLSDLYVVEGLK